MKYDYELWSKLAPWSKYKSDLILEVSTILTEPVCPSAKIRFELPARAGYDVIAHCHGDTLQEAIDNATVQAVKFLQNVEKSCVQDDSSMIEVINNKT